jgi:alkanesulfonate monooxygenase SsuD/methylene tetrahydromethanopterin reductase-like flavin-dependent oxidoreductase (luciferase family)
MEHVLFLPQMRLSLDDLVRRAQAAEAAGFAGIALMDHLAPPLAESSPMWEAMVAATWIAAHTDRLGIGHLVLCDALRHPAVLAKQAVTLDHASGGRFELGIGSSSVPQELVTFGITEDGAGARIARLGETLDVVRALWAGETVTFEGEHVRLRDASQAPGPLGTIPIVIGGSGPKTMALVRRHATWWNLPVHEIGKLEALRDQAGDARPSIQQMVAFVPDESSRSAVAETAARRFGTMAGGLVVGTGPELVEHFDALHQRGIERTYVWFTDFATPDTLSAYGAEVISGGS